MAECNGDCGFCQFPVDYPLVREALITYPKAGDCEYCAAGDEWTSSQDDICCGLWRMLEDGAGVPPVAREAVKELVMRG